MKNGTATETTTPRTTDRDLYQEVTNRIIAMIEKGVAPWRRTWSVYGLARNYVTGHIYTGINMILMNNTGHAVPYLMTYNQIQEKGGRLFHGAKANMVIYYMEYYKDINDITLTREEAILRRNNGEEIQILKFIRYYNVFNLAFIEGIEFEAKEVDLKPHERIDRCEKIIQEMPNPPAIRQVNASRAFYAPGKTIL